MSGCGEEDIQMINLKDVCGTDDKLAVILQGGEVIRYHTEGRQLDNQLVDSHTWRVMVILLHLFPDASLQLLKVAMYHDVTECYTGDLSAPLKRASPIIKSELDRIQTEFHQHFGLPLDYNLVNQDYARLKVADMLEAYITASQQNNRYAQVVADRALIYALEHAEELFEDFSDDDNILVKINQIVKVFGQYHHDEGRK